MKSSSKSLSLSESAPMKDRTREYSDLYMGVNHPLANLGDSGLFAGETRGVINHMTIHENTPTRARIRVSVIEPVILFPFEFATNANETGISQLDKMQVTFTMKNLNRMWSHDFVHGSVISSMETNLIDAFLLINHIAPPPNYEIPPFCVLPFDEFRPSPWDIGTFQPGEERRVVGPTIQFPSVPQQIFMRR